MNKERVRWCSKSILPLEWKQHGEGGAKERLHFWEMLYTPRGGLQIEGIMASNTESRQLDDVPSCRGLVL